MVVRPRVVLRAAALVIAAGVALVAQAASGDWTPWLWGVGALFVVVLLGARQRWGATVTATVALVVADLVWLLAMPWWGWVFLLSAACAGGVVWLVYTRRVRVRHPLSIGLSMAAGVAVVAASIGAVLHAQAAAEAERRAAAAQRQESISRILPHSPSAVPSFLVRTIAEDEPRSACLAFTRQAAAEFAAAHRQATCESAIRGLTAEVSDPIDYQNAFWMPGSQQSYDGETATLRVCDIDVAGTGPGSLGQLTIAPHDGGAGGFEITRWQPCGQ